MIICKCNVETDNIIHIKMAAKHSEKDNSLLQTLAKIDYNQNFLLAKLGTIEEKVAHIEAVTSDNKEMRIHMVNEMKDLAEENLIRKENRDLHQTVKRFKEESAILKKEHEEMKLQRDVCAIVIVAVGFLFCLAVLATRQKTY